MTRTGAYKVIYFVAVVGVVIAFGACAFWLRDAPTPWRFAWIAGFVLLLVPGRVQAFFWSDMLAGLHQLKARNYEVSRHHSERFLQQLQKRPWLRHLIWLGTSSYSRDIEAMTRNNLGAAMIKLGEFDDARAQLEHAIRLDPQCPLPYRNMGVLLLQTAPPGEALPWLEKARDMGLKGDWSDRIVTGAQERHASRAVGWRRGGPPEASAP